MPPMAILDTRRCIALRKPKGLNAATYAMASGDLPCPNRVFCPIGDHIQLHRKVVVSSGVNA